MGNPAIRKDIYLFLKGPNYNNFSDLKTREKIKILFKVLILTYVALFLVTIPMVILKKLTLIGEIPMKTDLLLNSLTLKGSDYKPYFIFSTVFLVPLLEEISHRLFLTKFRINYFLISVSLLLGMYLKIFLGNIFWMPKSYMLFSVMSFVYIVLISILIGGVLYLFKPGLIKIEEFWNQKVGLIFYPVAILFAIGHLCNLQYTNNDLIYMPLILLPFFVYGLSFGYLRIRLGIIYSIVLHFIFLALRFGLPELSSFLKAHASSIN